MKHLYLLGLILIGNAFLSYGQNYGAYGVVNPKNPYPTFQNGNATLGQMYNKTACGLDYTTASKKLGQRFHVATGSSCVPFDGVAQPATLPISGIPTCSVIDKAYLWCSTSGNGAAITATLQNPLGASANFPMTLVGSDYDKGWGATGSYTYRADVTAAITGNGNYIVSNLPTFSSYPVTGNDVDGVTLFIIFRDLNATYSATLVIDDGCMVGDYISHTVSGFNACATSNGEGFLIVSDMQDVNCSQVLANEITIGSVTYVATQEDWWNALAAPKTITAGQSSLFFSIDNFWTNDLYNFLVAGVYFQNTTCTVCTPAVISVGSSFTAANCGANDGTATVSPTGGTGTYTYSWNTAPVQTSQTATGLAAGTYTATVTDGNGCTATKSVTVTGGTAPTIGVSPSAPIICNGGSVSLTASGGTTYTWNPTSGLSAGSGATVTANPTTTTTYTVTGSNGGGCSGTSTVTVTVNAKPTIGISPSSATLCNGQSVSITASGANTYAWNPTSGLSAGTGANVNANPTSTTTYTVTGTNGNGCTNTAAITITVNAKPAITVNPTSASLCSGQSVSLTGGGGSTYAWGPATGLSATSGTVVSANPTSSTTYTVTGTDGNGCSNTASVAITVNPAPTITVNPTAPVLCNGQSVSLTGSGGSTYTWGPATGLSATTGSAVTANPTSTTTYTVTGTDGSGCSNTSTVTVTVNSKPTISINPVSATLCNGQSVSITASGGNTYTWNPSGGLSAGSGATVTANPTTTTTYTVTGTNGNGCTNTSAITITVNAKPTITVNPTSASICNGQSVSLTGGGGSTYTWGPAGGLSATSGSVVSANPTSTTTYTVTGTDGNGCSNTASVAVTVNAKPTITINPSAPVICNGQSVSLTGGGGSTYIWSPGTGLSATSGSVVSANPTATTTYTVTGTDGNGCSNTTTVAVTVNAKPTITVSPTTTSICNGQSVSLTGGGGTSYVWSPTTGLSAGSGSVVSANPTTTTIYTVAGSDANGCSNTASVTVNVSPKPTITASPIAPVICNGQSVSLTGSGGNTYTWGPSTGLSATSGSVVSANPTSTTSYTVTGTDASGCSNTASVTVNVNQLPAITVNPVTSILCSGQSVTLTAGGGTSYVWNPTGGLSAGSGAVVSANPTSTTIYTVIGTDANGCSNTANTTVNINPKPAISVNPAAPVLCTGQSISLTASGGTSYVWSPSSGLSAGSGSVVSANPSSTTTYTVIGTDANGCTNTTVVTVTVNATATITVNPTTPIICNGQSVSLTAGGGNTYVWSPTTGLSSGTGATVSANPTSTTTYTVTGTAGSGCSNTASVTVTVNQRPSVTVSPVSAILCNGQSVSLTAGGGTSYVWSPSSGLSAGSGATVSANPNTTTTYTVTGTDANGCSNTSSTTITVNPLPAINISPATAAICTGQSVSLSASGGTSYIWNPTSGLSAGTGSIVSANPSATTTYTVTGSNANGCTNTSSITVTVNPLPVITVSPITTSICNGKSVPLNAGGGTSYSWTPTAGLSAGTGASVTANPSNTTIYTVTGTDANGCSSTAGTTVTVNSLPSVGVTPGAPAICTGSNVSMSASGATSYAWSPTAGLSSGTGTTVSANPVVTSTYTVTGTDANGCSNTSSVTVTVNSLPVVSASPTSAAICSGESAPITASGASSYAWGPSGGLSSVSGAVVSASPVSTTTYTVTGTDGNGCSNTASSTITVNPLPVVNAGPDVNICPNNTAQLNVTGPPVGSNYIWTPSSALSCSNCPNPVASPASSATYVVFVTSPAGCSAQDTVSVLVTPLSALAAPDTIVCYGSTVMLQASGGTNYSWLPTTGLINPNTANPMATPFVETTYTVTVSSGSCSATATATIQVYPEVPIPVITQSMDTLYCSYNKAYVTYQWYYNSSTIANATHPFYKAPQSGNYNVAVTDTNGCTTSVGINIVLNVGLQTLSDNSAFTLSPNPATSEIMISGKGFEEATIIVFNTIGEKVLEERTRHTDHATLNISGLAQGMYFISVEQPHSRWSSRFVKE